MVNPYEKNQAISAEEASKIVPRAEFRVLAKTSSKACKSICGSAKLRFTPPALCRLRPISCQEIPMMPM